MQYTHLNEELAYTTIEGFYEAVYKRLHFGAAVPDDYVFEPSKVYCSKDIFFRIREYYRQELGWTKDDDFSFSMDWCNSGGHAIDDLINYTVFVAEDWCHPKEEPTEESEETPEEDSEVSELLERLFPGKRDLYTADKADVGYYISDIVIGEPGYYYMESIYESAPFYLNTAMWHKEADGVAYAIPACSRDDDCYSYDECVAYSYDDIYEVFKDEIDEDHGFVEVIRDLLHGQTIDELKEELEGQDAYELRRKLYQLP